MEVTSGKSSASIQAPQWMSSAFVRACKSEGATADDKQIKAVFEVLLENWSTPGRRVHDIKHLVSVLESLDIVSENMHYPYSARLATWYHGLDYWPGRFSCDFFGLIDPESIMQTTQISELCKKSYETKAQHPHAAATARLHITELGMPEAAVTRVCEMIESLYRCPLVCVDANTFHDKPIESGNKKGTGKYASGDDKKALHDAHLSLIAIDPQRYRNYLEALKADWGVPSSGIFLRGRLRLVDSLLNRASVFLSPIGQQWEEAARENLQAEHERISAALAKIDPGEEHTGQVPVAHILDTSEKPLPVPEELVDNTTSRGDLQLSTLEDVEIPLEPGANPEIENRVEDIDDAYPISPELESLLEIPKTPAAAEKLSTLQDSVESKSENVVNNLNEIDVEIGSVADVRRNPAISIESDTDVTISIPQRFSVAQRLALLEELAENADIPVEETKPILEKLVSQENIDDDVLSTSTLEACALEPAPAPQEMTAEQIRQQAKEEFAKQTLARAEGKARPPIEE